MKRRIGALATVLFLLSVCRCFAFQVPLHDGTSKEVTKIEFRGSQSDLYLKSGMVMTVPTDAIEFKAMGMQRPDPPFGITQDGKTLVKKQDSAAPTKETEAGPPQKELKAQWDGSSQAAVALRDTGSIRKGRTVHVVESNDLSVTVISQDSDGKYRRAVLSSSLFADNFEVSQPQERPKAPQKPVAPATAPAPAAQPAAPVGFPKEFGNLPDTPTIQVYPLWIPLAMSFALLAAGFGITLILYRVHAPAPKKR